MPQNGTSREVSVDVLCDQIVLAGPGIERVQHSGRAHRVDAILVNRRRAPRAGAAVRFVETNRIRVTPHRLARRDAITRDDLLVAALLLRVEQIAANRERRPAGPNRSPPHLRRWSRRPVGVDANAANDAVAIRSAESRPLRRSSLFHHHGNGSRSDRLNLLGRPAPQVFTSARRLPALESRRPAPAATVSILPAPRASSNSSGVGVHRQCMSMPLLPPIPPVRTRLIGTLARMTVAMSARRRVDGRASRVATAHTTSASISGWTPST